MSFDLALSGINAANTDLNVTSNNIANVATTGFKQSRAEFADLYAQSQGGVSKIAVGNGVRVADVAQQFSQGNLTSTSNNLDLAINGSGFFVLSSGGALSYTRAGAFQVDGNGNIVNNSGEALQGYPALANGGFNTGGLSNLVLTTAENAPKATTTASLTLNLPASATVPTNPTFDPTDPKSYTNTTSLTTYDSLGAAHTSQLYFIKGAAANAWNAQLYVDGNAVGTPQALTYSNAGALTAPAGGKLTFPAYTPATGAAPMNMTFNFSGTTQFGDAFTVNAVSQDGYTTGRLIGIAIDQTGVVQARFTNGQSTSLGQVALANFANPQGLQQLGNTQWAQTFASGSAVTGVAGNSGFGTMQSGQLEGANVDMTTQLVKMIQAQRDFQANAQVISVTDSITQTIINIHA
ncbi:MAG: flagellar biosynthesis protein FlgE [Gammaproteobacteria bacterium]|nr:flagellar biosynthesis protein FlgE [Gammaproteobacteria bacterium]